MDVAGMLFETEIISKNKTHIHAEQAAQFTVRSLVIAERNSADERKFTLWQERNGWWGWGGTQTIAVEQNNSLPGHKTQFTADRTASDSVMTTALQQQCGNFISRAHSARRILGCDARSISDCEKLTVESCFGTSLIGQNEMTNVQ